MSLRIWYKAVAPPIRKLWLRNLCGGSPSATAARSNQAWI
jgi:hypothetical protein